MTVNSERLGGSIMLSEKDSQKDDLKVDVVMSSDGGYVGFWSSKASEKTDKKDDQKTAQRPDAQDASKAKTAIEAQGLNFFYGKKQALHNINLKMPERSVTAFIGPSGCGKSTFLRTINRMNDIIPDVRIEGKLLLDERDIYTPGVDVVDLRRRVGMVFQKSNPFPKSIFENVAYGIRINQ